MYNDEQIQVWNAHHLRACHQYIIFPSTKLFKIEEDLRSSIEAKFKTEVKSKRIQPFVSSSEVHVSKPVAQVTSKKPARKSKKKRGVVEEDSTTLETVVILSPTPSKATTSKITLSNL